MNEGKSPKYYLVAAIIWTVISAVALVLLMLATGNLFPKLCGVVLVSFCVTSQWMRYRKMK